MLAQVFGISNFLVRNIQLLITPKEYYFMRAEVLNLGITANVCQNYAGNLPRHYGMLLIFLTCTHWTLILLLPRHDDQDCQETAGSPARDGRQ